MTKLPALILAVLTCATPVLAQSRTEVFAQGATTITLTLPAFLTEDETAILRLVGESPDALALFLPAGAGFGAMALAPADGFLRDGAPVESAAAVGDLPDLTQARDAALAQCNAARTGGEGCVVVLEIAPQ
jgi:hypothetical protein